MNTTPPTPIDAAVERLVHCLNVAQIRDENRHEIDKQVSTIRAELTAAKARIWEAEKREQLAMNNWNAEAEMLGSKLQAAEADNSRLREALTKIAHPPYGLGFNKLRGLARAALNQGGVE